MQYSFCQSSGLQLQCFCRECIECRSAKLLDASSKQGYSFLDIFNSVEAYLVSGRANCNLAPYLEFNCFERLRKAISSLIHKIALH